MPQIADHPDRYALANELHARPFPTLKAPGQAVFLAIKREHNAAGRDRGADVAHLLALLDRYGAPHPQPGATHYSGAIGAHRLKWESHTEFVTYTVFMEGPTGRAFDPALFEVFPPDWLAAAPGVRMTSALLHVVEEADPAAIRAQLGQWFVDESLAVSQVLDAAAVIAGDFRIDPAGHMRFAVFLAPGTGSQRAGRVVQRLCEIETYKSMAMLGFRRVREMQPDLGALDRRLSELVTGLDAGEAMPETSLHRLMEISAEGERLSARSSFRFGATGAYEAIVNQRIEVLREQRYEGWQTFGEFMMRRFDPAMRTVKSTRSQLESLATRAQRASELLRTQVDVARAAQNQALLASMDRRSDLALRLQQTVEGLSVVAISYYAVNLLAYALAPLAKGAGVEKSLLTAGLVPFVVIAVWWVVRRIRKAMH
ncbi:DUF3422 family protein [Pseudoruegeria aquimaris]|nr:DUF3422 domain-containing protein [Pseudoruegeria aquimaris]